nr:MAG: hypothetical protein DIU78_21500 [Pseudomonadota bacterium]
MDETGRGSLGIAAVCALAIGFACRAFDVGGVGDTAAFGESGAGAARGVSRGAESGEGGIADAETGGGGGEGAVSGANVAGSADGGQGTGLEGAGGGADIEGGAGGIDDEGAAGATDGGGGAGDEGDGGNGGSGEEVGGEKGWDPSRLSGLVLWLSASRGVDVDDDGRVRAWSDLSGRQNDARQSEPVRRPRVRATIANGLPGVQFDGVESTLEIQDSRSLNWVLPLHLVEASEDDLAPAI